MKEIFKNESVMLSINEELNVPFLQINSFETDSYKDSVSKLCSILNEKKCEFAIVDRSLSFESISADMKWINKSIIPLLKKCNLKKIIFVVGEDKISSKNDEYPFDFLSSFCKLERVLSIEDAWKVIENADSKKVDEKILSMTRKEALAYLGLPKDATLFMIDDKFWQLSKRYRKDNSPEAEAKLEELTTVYDIATGERDKRNKQAEIYSQQKKFLGKTGDEWKTYLSYTWYKYLIGLGIIILACNLFYTMVLKPRYDVSIVALGHIRCETEVLEGILIDDCGYKVPYVNCVDVVPENDEGQTDNGYGDQTAATVLMSQPNVIITDTVCYYYYFDQFADCSELYEQLRSILPEEAFAKLTPIYYSERDYQELLYEYEMSLDLYEYETDESVFEQYDPTPKMIGIRVDDEDFMAKLGFENLWHYKPKQLIFGIGANSGDILGAQNIIIEILKKLV